MTSLLLTPIILWKKLNSTMKWTHNCKPLLIKLESKWRNQTGNYEVQRTQLQKCKWISNESYQC